MSEEKAVHSTIRQTLPRPKLASGMTQLLRKTLLTDAKVANLLYPCKKQPKNCRCSESRACERAQPRMNLFQVKAPHKYEVTKIEAHEQANTSIGARGPISTNKGGGLTIETAKLLKDIEKFNEKVLNSQFKDVNLHKRDDYIMSTHPTDLPDDIYLNNFHRKWNEVCLRANEKMQSTPCSAEFLRAQSKRLEEHYRNAGKKSKK